ncbi:hypothetical protein D3C81_1615760 [compost metagenome]
MREGQPFQHLTRGHVGREARRFDHGTNAAHDGGIARVLAQDPDLARRRPDQAQQDAEQGGLAGAVGAQHAVNPAARDGEAEPVQGAHGAIGLGQAGRFDNSGHAAELGPMGISGQAVFCLSQIKLRQSPRSGFGVPHVFSRRGPVSGPAVDRLRYYAG